MERRLKKDLLGAVWLVQHSGALGTAGLCVLRDTTTARRWLRPLARRLALREAKTLRSLAGLRGIPQVIECSGTFVLREYIEGRPMQAARPRSTEYFKSALRLVSALHRRGIVHNDLAKEANWLCTPEGRAAIVDFQVAVTSRRRGALFRALAREDLRHLLKHKRTYLPDKLTARQRAMLARPGMLAHAWRVLIKPPYRLITRHLLGWPERTGPWEREDSV